MIETLMVLGISATFIAGSVSLYGQANSARQTREAISEIYAIIASVRPTGFNKGNYVNLPAGGTGEKYGVGAPPWGGAYKIERAGEHSEFFTIIFADVPEVPCTRIVQSLVEVLDIAVKVDSATTPALAATRDSGTRLADAMGSPTSGSDHCGTSTQIGVAVR